MKIGIISDTHGMYDSWKRIYEQYFHDCDYILHAGDILYHGPCNKVLTEYDPAQLAHELNELSVPIICAHGNCDSEVDSMLLKHPVQSPYVFAHLGGKRVLVAHGHYFEDAQYMRAVAERYKIDIFVYGHIHLPVLEKVDNTLFVNPGSPALSKLERGEGTIALWQNDIISTIYWQSGEIRKQVNINE